MCNGMIILILQDCNIHITSCSKLCLPSIVVFHLQLDPVPHVWGDIDELYEEKQKECVCFWNRLTDLSKGVTFDIQGALQVTDRKYVEVNSVE